MIKDHKNYKHLKNPNKVTLYCGFQREMWNMHCPHRGKPTCVGLGTAVKCRTCDGPTATGHNGVTAGGEIYQALLGPI